MPIERKELILSFGKRIIEIHRGVSLLGAIKWPSDLEDFLVGSDFKINPKIDFKSVNPVEFYELKKCQISALKKDLRDSLSATDEMFVFFEKQLTEISKIIEMISSRGENKFYELSKELYGTIKNQDELFLKLENLYFNFKTSDHFKKSESKKYSAYEAKLILENRLKKHFPNEKFKIKISSKMTSDASTGSDYIKINSKHHYSKADLLLFEYHEGLVHLGSNLNASYSQNAPWLLKALPSATMSQEGLAVFVEFFCETMSVKRLETLFLRIMGIKLAEEGRSFIQVINYFRERGLSDRKAINLGKRIFRGCSLEGGYAFTKDLTYLLGFIEVYEFIQSNLLNEKNPVDFLFSGKVSVKDIELLQKLEKDGLINRPIYIPLIFKDKKMLLQKMQTLDLFNTEKIKKVA